jgi:hypothetical protein
MAIDFKLKDVMHRIITKFYPAYLPNAKKKFIMRAVYQPELDIHDVASKAEIYNITTSPKVIEEGMLAGMELISYLVADGYKIVTPIFTLKIVIPGEYDGTETHLAHGVTPQGRLNISSSLREFIKDNVTVQIDGIEESNGMIAEVINQVTGEIDTTVSLGGLFTIHGIGLKIEFDDLHIDEVGVFFEDINDGSRVKIDPVDIAVNVPHEIRAIANANVGQGHEYYIVVCTQSSLKGGKKPLKIVREMKSDFAITIL